MTCSPARLTVRVGWPSAGSSATTAVGEEPGGAFTSQAAAEPPVCAPAGRAVTAVASNAEQRASAIDMKYPFSRSVIR